MITKHNKLILKTSSTIIMISILISLLNPMREALPVQAKESATSTDEAVRGMVAKIDTNTFDIMEKIPSTISWGVDNPYSRISPINDFWGEDGNYHIIYSGEKKVYISILNQNLQLQKTLEITKDLPIVGNVAQDKNGNYYIAYGEYDKTSAANNADKIVMSIVQYNSKGELLNKLTYTGKDTDPYKSSNFGTKEPFNYANCEIIIDTSGVLVCRYGRVMYNGHQSSHTLYVDTATMTKLNYVSPYTSHSFNQKVIATSDGGYLFAERGDAYDRGIVISKITNNTKDVWSVPSFVPFHFRNGYIYQTTYATIAGIAECTNGYAIVGASEKTLSYDKAKDAEYNESRNIFMQVIKKNFTSNSSNSPNVHVLQGEDRIAEGNYISGSGNCEANAKDYGILWLTNYTGTFYASVPKLINIGNDQLLIMWEKKQCDTSYEVVPYIESYYMVVGSDGSVITSPTVIQDVRLPEYGEPDYKDGKIYWTNSDRDNKQITIHTLTIGQTTPAKIKVAGIKVKQNYIVARAGQKTPIEVVFSPANADNKNIIYEDYDTDLISIDSKGYITVKEPGETEVYLYSKENENLSAIVTICATDTAPSGLKAISSGNKVKLTWKKSKLASSYEIYRSTRKDSGYKHIGSADHLYYYDDRVEDGKTYYYKVVAANDYWYYELNQNPYSTPASIYVLTSPKGLSVKKSSNTSVLLTWSKNNKADGYEIYYYNESTKSYQILKTITSNSTISYKKSNLKTKQTYRYKIRSYKTIKGVKNYSSFSKEVKITL